MSETILSSTFLLTLLLAVGLFFFIRASVKDRTKKVKLIAPPQPEESLLAQLKQYFSERSYQVARVDRAENQVTFQGFVRPSWFLTIFLTLLALCGIFCLVLVLSQLFPNQGGIFLILLLLAPASGWFYWQKAGRLEQVLLKVESVATEDTTHSMITVTAHRDELEALQQALQLQMLEV